MYIWFTGTADLKGTSSGAEVKGKDAIEILSYSHNVSMPLSGSQASGQTRHQGRSHHSDFTFTKYVDVATPFFNAYCSGGNNIKESTVAVFQAAETGAAAAPNKFIEYHLTDVIFTSVSVGGGGGDLPIETITMNYATIKWTFNQQDNKTGSKAAGDKSTSWSLLTNAKE